MKMYIKKISMALLTACVVFSGCSKSDWSTDPPSPEKIAATNEVRKQLGIREINHTWSFYGREFGAEKWKTNNMLCKVVQYDNKYEVLLREHDNYYSGRLIPSVDGEDGPSIECLFVFYDYPTKRVGLAVTTDNEEIEAMIDALRETTPDDYGGQPPGYMCRTNDETLEVADKILKMWGLSRL